MPQSKVKPRKDPSGLDWLARLMQQLFTQPVASGSGAPFNPTMPAPANASGTGAPFNPVIPNMGANPRQPAGAMSLTGMGNGSNLFNWLFYMANPLKYQWRYNYGLPGAQPGGGPQPGAPSGNLKYNPSQWSGMGGVPATNNYVWSRSGGHYAGPVNDYGLSALNIYGQGANGQPNYGAGAGAGPTGAYNTYGQPMGTLAPIIKHQQARHDMLGVQKTGGEPKDPRKNLEGGSGHWTVQHGHTRGPEKDPTKVKTTPGWLTAMGNAGWRP